MIRYYWEIYKQFISTSFTMEMSYRTHFFLLIFMDLLFYFTALASVDFIYSHVTHIGLWTKPELMFFVAVTIAIDQIHMALFAANFWMFSDHLRTGQLDFLLIKPAGSVFSVFFRYVRPSSLSNLVVAWGLVIYFGLQVHLSVLSWILLPLLVALGLSILVLVEIILSISMFWLIQGLGVNFLRMQLQAMGRWPDFIYTGVVRRLFTFGIPILLVVNAPVRFLFDHSDWWPLALLVVMLAIGVVVLRKLWTIGLARYESASS